MYVCSSIFHSLLRTCMHESFKNVQVQLIKLVRLTNMSVFLLTFKSQRIKHQIQFKVQMTKEKIALKLPSMSFSLVSAFKARDLKKFTQSNAC